MNVPNWLITDTNMYHWVLKICYLHLVYPNNASTINEYRLEFENDDRYIVEININNKNYTCTLWMNNNSIYKFDFIDPIDFTSKLFDCNNNTKVAIFVDLLINQCGFNVPLLKKKSKMNKDKNIIMIKMKSR